MEDYYQVQFTEEDVIAKFKEIKQVKEGETLEDAVSRQNKNLTELLEKEESIMNEPLPAETEIEVLDKEIEQLKSINNKLHNISHDLSSPLANVSGMIQHVMDTDFNNEPNKFGLEIFQRAYLSNIKSLSDLAKIHATTATGAVNDFTLKASSLGLVETIISLSEYLDINQNLVKIKPLSQIGEDFVDMSDKTANLVVYAYNEFFAPSFQRDTYNLDQDLKIFELNYDNTPGIKLTIKNALGIRTNENYKSGVVNNLISNALRFGTEVIVSSYDDEKNNEIIMTVMDNGPGVPQENLEKVFEKGFSTKTDNQVDHGIGLHSSKSFVEENGGRMWCESKPGRTEFKFTIPYSVKEEHFYKQ